MTEFTIRAFQGIPLEDGKVAVDDAGAITHYHQGIPMTAEGRVAVTIDGTVSYLGAGAAGFDTAGRMVISAEGAVANRAVNGVGYLIDYPEATDWVQIGGGGDGPEPVPVPDSLAITFNEVAVETVPNPFAGANMGEHTVLVNNDGTRIFADVTNGNGSNGAVYMYAFDKATNTATFEREFKSAITTFAEFGLYQGTMAINREGTVFATGQYRFSPSGVSQAGDVYIYTDQGGGTWAEQIISSNDKDTSGEFGRTLTLSNDGTILAVCYSGWDGPSGTQNGIGCIEIWVLNSSTGDYEYQNRIINPFYGVAASLGQWGVKFSDDDSRFVTAYPGYNATFDNQGALYVYDRGDDDWLTCVPQIITFDTPVFNISPFQGRFGLGGIAATSIVGGYAGNGQCFIWVENPAGVWTETQLPNASTANRWDDTTMAVDGNKFVTYSTSSGAQSLRVFENDPTNGWQLAQDFGETTVQGTVAWSRDLEVLVQGGRETGLNIYRPVV